MISAAPISGIKLTQAGTLLGSPQYMSPEQAWGHPDVDDRSDVWSFCVVLYEALSGQPPFSASDCRALLLSVVRDTPLPLEVFAGVRNLSKPFIISTSTADASRGTWRNTCFLGGEWTRIQWHSLASGYPAGHPGATHGHQSRRVAECTDREAALRHRYKL